MEEVPGEPLKEAGSEFTRQYKLSLWWVNNKEKVKKVGYGIFIAFDAVLLLFVLWTAIDTYLISYDAEIGAVNQMVALGQEDLHAFTTATAARDLDIGRVTVLSAGDGAFDFYVPVTNPNDDWWAEFTYIFKSSAGETEESQGFILPGEQEKPVVEFEASEGRATSVSLEIVDIDWHRVNHHETGDYSAYAAERLRFDITDVQLQQQLELEGSTVGRVSFTVENRGAFSFFDPEFYLVLTRGPNVVGVNRTQLVSIDAGERAEVNVNWFGTLPSASKVDVIPSVNIFDPGVYKALEGDRPTDSRTQ